MEYQNQLSFPGFKATNIACMIYRDYAGILRQKMEIFLVEPLDEPGLINYIKERKISFSIANQYLKGCTSKHCTTVPGRNNDQLNIFEGFFDFLSAIELGKTLQPKFDSIILNSVALKRKTISHISKYEKINLFMDNDPAGIEAVNFYRENHENVKDFSVTLYPYPYNDLNEYLVEKKKHLIYDT